MNPRRKRSSMKLQGSKRAKITPIAPSSSVGVVRLGRVAEARRRIASGWYDRAEVRDRLVELMLVEIREH